MANQFNNQLGYFQGNLEDVADFTPSTTGTFETIDTIEITDQPIYQYNTQLNARGNIQFLEKGIWRIDFVGTWQGATNDDLSIRGKTTASVGYINALPEVKWNARGGNNWAISYSVMFQVMESLETLTFELKNDDDTPTSTLLKGIFTAIKLY